MRQSEPKLIVNVALGCIVCEHCVVADRAFPRMRGLLGRRTLPAGEGLLLRPAPSIHTAFMRFAIDAVFLDSEMRIVKLAAHLRPWRTAAASRARAVLELSDGEIARRVLEVDAQLTVLDHAVRSPHPDGRPQTRVLLVATDRRFRTVASALLTRRSYSVTVHAQTDDIAELAVRERADVAVIDATGSLTAAARETARLRTLLPHVGVVAVSDDPHDGLLALPVLPKWGSFGPLFAAIEQARGDQELTEGLNARC